MRISLIEDSYRNCFNRHPTTTLVIPTAGFYEGKNLGTSAPKLYQSFNSENMTGSTEWFIKSILNLSNKDDLTRAFREFGHTTGNQGSFGLYKDRKFQDKSIFYLTTHKLPGTIGYEFNNSIDHLMYCLMHGIYQSHYGTTVASRNIERLSIGPLFWDPMYKLDTYSKPECILSMIKYLSKLEMDMSVDIYTQG